MLLISQHLELGNIFINISISHSEFLKVIIGLLLLCIVYKGLLKVFFKYCPEGSVQEFIDILFYIVQLIIVLLDPSLGLLSSNIFHKVGAFIVGVSGYSGVLVHNHKLSEGD
jgi:hypothetical protein